MLTLTIPKPADARPQYRGDIAKWRMFHTKMRRSLRGYLRRQTGARVTLVVLRPAVGDGKGSEVSVEGEGVTAAMLADWRDTRFMSGGEIREIAHAGGMVVGRGSSAALRVVLAALGLPGLGAALGGMVDAAAEVADAAYRDRLDEDTGARLGASINAVHEAFKVLANDTSEEAVGAAGRAMPITPAMRAAFAAQLVAMASQIPGG